MTTHTSKPVAGGVEVHGYVNCPFAWRVRLAAAELGLPFEWLPVDVEAPDARVAEHNPDEHSPLLWEPGFSLLESEIIVQYLDEKFAGGKLWPKDAQERAELRFVSTRLRGLDVHTEPSRAEARRRSGPALDLVEAVLSSSGDYLHGEQPGAVDVTWWPFLANIAGRGLLGDTRPAVSAYLKRVVRRPSFSGPRPEWAAAL